MLKLSIILATLAQIATSTFIMLPLYIYPGDKAVAWNSVFTLIAKYPKVQWQIIVNPNSGPGGAANSYPDSNFVTGLSKFNSYSNVMTLGYVSTNYTNRAYKNVTTDINTYANWAAYPSANISVAGIFFDEQNISSSSAAVQYYKNASAVAYANVPSQVTPVVFNPGALAPAAYFNYADTIVEFEGYYSAYKNQTTISSIPSAQRPQSAIIAHDTTANQTTLNSLVHNMIVNKIGAVYFTNDTIYQAIQYLPMLAAAVNAG